MAAEKRPELKVLYTSGQGVTDGMIALFVDQPLVNNPKRWLSAEN
jgi:hypothetical protein